MSRKVFTAGEVLAAADVNSFLMDQSIMSFAGTAARGSAIGTATEGMYTHLEDTDALQFWNGSAWVSPFGMTLLNTTSFTSAGTVSINNVFSSSYTNYKILLGITGVSGGLDVNLRMRNAGTDSAVNYNRSGITTFFNTTAITVLNQVGTTSGILLPAVVREISADITVSNPAVASETVLIFQGSGLSASAVANVQAGILHDVASAFDGFTLFTSAGTMTGNLSVYGLRK
jgi:hypothetical protein